MLILLGLYWTGIAVHRISHLVSSELFTQFVSALVNPVAFILFLIFFVGLLEARGLKSGMLQFLGKYSFEVYLLHFPFMVYYDFFIFRKPLVFFFFVYAIFVLLLSVLLQRAAVCLDGFIFSKISKNSWCGPAYFDWWLTCKGRNSKSPPWAEADYRSDFGSPQLVSSDSRQCYQKVVCIATGIKVVIDLFYRR